MVIFRPGLDYDLVYVRIRSELDLIKLCVSLLVFVVVIVVLCCRNIAIAWVVCLFLSVYNTIKRVLLYKGCLGIMIYSARCPMTELS